MKLRLDKAIYRSKLSSLLIAAFVALFCVQIVITPVSAATSEKQKVDTFFKEYDPEKEYHSAPEAVISMPDGSPIEGEVEEGEWVFEEFDNEEFQKKEAKKAGKPVPKKLNWWEKTTQWAGEQYQKGKKWMQSKVQQVTGKEKKTQKKPVLNKVNQKQPQSKWEQFKGWVGGKVEGVKKTVSSVFNKTSQNVSSGTVDIIPIINIPTPSWLKWVFGQTSEQKQNKVNKEVIEKIEKKHQINIDESPKRSWTPNELKWMDETLENLPNEFHNKDGLTEITRDNLPDSPSTCGMYSPIFKNVAIVNNQVCSNGKGLQNHSEENAFKHALTHELVHSYQQTHEKEENKFAELSWEKKETQVYRYIIIKSDFSLYYETKADIWVKKDKVDNFVSSYAYEDNLSTSYQNLWTEDVRTDSKTLFGHPNEDMAETYALYFNDPCKVLIYAPDKFKYINDQFNRYNNLSCK